MSTGILFEQPLNERVRSFLRLEHLFSNVDVRIHGQSEWDSREALTHIIEIADLLSRSDLKGELIKELERHASTLNNLKDNPAVDSDRLQTILQGINGLAEQLRSPNCQPAQSIRADDLVNAIKQRSTIPGGSCGFDLPAYHHWLNQPMEIRIRDLDRWYRDLRIIRDAVSYSLSIIRNSATPQQAVAENGMFQQGLESGTSCQLIRVVLPADSPYYPEISGSKHRFTLRFMYREDTHSRPSQAGENIEFELHCCVL